MDRLRGKAGAGAPLRWATVRPRPVETATSSEEKRVLVATPAWSGCENGQHRRASKMRVQTILNRVLKNSSFVYADVRPLEEAVCSRCHARRPGYDRLPPRRFQFVPLWGILVFFVYVMRSVDLPTCGVVVEEVPWAAGKSRLTTTYAWFLARWAKRMSWLEVARTFHIGWAVGHERTKTLRGQARPPSQSMNRRLKIDNRSVKLPLQRIVSVRMAMLYAGSSDETRRFADLRSTADVPKALPTLSLVAYTAVTIRPTRRESPSTRTATASADRGLALDRRSVLELEVDEETAFRSLSLSLSLSSSSVAEASTAGHFLTGSTAASRAMRLRAGSPNAQVFGTSRRVRSVISPRLNGSCRPPLLATAAIHCALSEVVGAALPTSVTVEVLRDHRRFGRRYLRFRLRYYGLPVQDSLSHLYLEGGQIRHYTGEAHVTVDRIRTSGRARPLSGAAVRSRARHFGSISPPRWYDAAGDRFLYAVTSSTTPDGYITVVDERTGRTRRRATGAYNDPQPRLLATQICRGRFDTCASTQVIAPTSTVVASNVERHFTSTPGECRFEGRPSLSEPSLAPLEDKMPYLVRELEYPPHPLYQYPVATPVERLDEPCDGNFSTNVTLGSPEQRFAHVWSNDIRNHILTSELKTIMANGNNDFLEIQIKDLSKEAICLTTSNACVFAHHGTLRLEMRRNALNDTDGPGIGTLAHEFGHVLQQQAGQFDTIFAPEVFYNSDMREGSEGFAEAIRLSYMLHRFELNRPSFDALNLNSTSQISGGDRINTTTSTRALLGAYFPLPRRDRPTLKQVRLAQYDSYRCPGGDPHECGMVLARAFWMTYWNRFPVVSRNHPAGDSVIRGISIAEARSRARAALAEVTNGGLSIHELLVNFRNALVGLTPAASEHARIDEMFRQLCVDVVTGQQHPACRLGQHYPELPLPVGSLKTLKFADGLHDVLHPQSRTPGNQLFLSSAAAGTTAEFVPAKDMSVGGGANKMLVRVDQGVSYEVIDLAANGHMASFPITFPNLLTGSPGPFDYPIRYLTRNVNCTPAGLRLRFKQNNATVATVDRPFPVGSPSVCANSGSAPTAAGSTVTLNPGLYTVEVSRMPGTYGTIRLSALVFEGSCPNPTDSNGDGIPDACDPGFCVADSDNDGICDADDNCPNTTTCLDPTRPCPDPSQRDIDNDGFGDVCDLCRMHGGHANIGLVDTDTDGFCDYLDNCVAKANSSQADLDGDGLGDACDDDVDGDGVDNDIDRCKYIPSTFLGQNHADVDNDGVGDECDCDTQDVTNPRWFRDCEDVLRAGRFDQVHEAAVELARAFQRTGIISTLEGVGWDRLDGCLHEPCDTLPPVNPAFESVADLYAEGSREVGYGARYDFLKFILENTDTDLGGHEIENYVDWLFTTKGEELVRP